MAQDNLSGASIYKHNQESVQRPDVGVEAQFPNKKSPKTYRYGRWHYLLVTDPGRLGLMLNDFTEASWDEGPFALT